LPFEGCTERSRPLAGSQVRREAFRKNLKELERKKKIEEKAPEAPI
jgi:hypothetical protein